MLHKKYTGFEVDPSEIKQSLAILNYACRNIKFKQAMVDKVKTMLIGTQGFIPSESLDIMVEDTVDTLFS